MWMACVGGVWLHARMQLGVHFFAPHERGNAFRANRRGIDRRPQTTYRIYTMSQRSPTACCEEQNSAPDLRPVEGKDADEELADLAKAVGHAARVQILRILARKNACVCGDLVDELPLAQSTVSQHLKVLKDAGVIRGEVDGPRVCYCIEPRTLRRLKALVGGL